VNFPALTKFASVLPRLNEAENIEEVLDRVVAESPSPLQWELLAVDDDSRDETSRIVRRYADKENRVRLVEPLRTARTFWSNYQMAGHKPMQTCWL
jgi:glycosyltransferase involved in cell wall biosynthesis